MWWRVPQYSRSLDRLWNSPTAKTANGTLSLGRPAGPFVRYSVGMPSVKGHRHTHFSDRRYTRDTANRTLSVGRPAGTFLGCSVGMPPVKGHLHTHFSDRRHARGTPLKCAQRAPFFGWIIAGQKPPRCLSCATLDSPIQIVYCIELFCSSIVFLIVLGPKEKALCRPLARK